jgi:hypothetical protein
MIHGLTPFNQGASLLYYTQPGSAGAAKGKSLHDTYHV